MFAVNLKFSVMIRPYFSLQNVHLSQSHVPAEEENGISSSTMIDWTAPLQFKILFLIIAVSLYIATRMLFWSCIFPGKYVIKPYGFKVLRFY